MRMYNPPHPGKVLKELYMKPLKLTVTKTAKALGVSRKTMSEIVNGRAPVTPEMAMRIGTAFNTTPESWMNNQIKYDLWQLEHSRPKLKGIKRLYRPDDIRPSA